MTAFRSWCLPAARSFKATLTTALAIVCFVALSGVVSADQNQPLAPLPDPIEVDEAKAALGEMLFFDTRLSGDTSLSCASCHDPEHGWSDGRALSDGYTGVGYFRNSRSLFNVGYREHVMWDARLDGRDLPTVVRDMITEAHTMNADTRLVQERLKQIPVYVEMFEEAFGPGDPYGGKIYSALAEYLKTIRSENAPLERYLRGDESALSPAQKRGKDLFTGKANCAACHSGPTLSDDSVHALGVPDHPEVNADPSRQVTMLRHFATLGVPNYIKRRSDVGHFAVTKEDGDLGKFLTPSLWDVAQRPPYMHSGVFETLEEVVAFYNGGGGQHPNKSEKIVPLGLSDSEQRDLIAFLESLTGDAPDTRAPDLPGYELRQLGQN